LVDLHQVVDYSIHRGETARYFVDRLREKRFDVWWKAGSTKDKIAMV
jgi:hypothetical protein